MKQNKDYLNAISGDGRTLDFSEVPVVLESSHICRDGGDLSLGDFFIIDFIDRNRNRIDATKVRHIRLVRCHSPLFGNLECITDATLLHIADKFPHLDSLTVGGSLRITDEGIIGIVEKIGNNLKSLNYSGCKRCTDAALQAIVQNCPSLECLRAANSGITSIPKNIGHRLPKLTELDLANNKIKTIPWSIKLPGNRFRLTIHGNPANESCFSPLKAIVSPLKAIVSLLEAIIFSPLKTIVRLLKIIVALLIIIVWYLMSIAYRMHNGLETFLQHLWLQTALRFFD
jgi:hypothetical protein